MEVDADSPGTSPPAAKRQKIAEKVDLGFYSFNRDSPELALFKKYYKNIVPEAEFDSFFDTLFLELPTTFRICSGREDVMRQLIARVESIAQEINRIPTPQATSSDATPSSVEDQDPYLKPLVWYPDGMGWQVQSGKTKLRKAESEVVQRLRTFMIDQTAIGHMSRQEAVSMVPPLFMKVQEHHKVLDMCAAPGSKTAQLIEMLHRDAPESYNPSSLKNTHVPGYHGLVRGFVHANDAAGKRCNTLITQTRRLASPSLVVTHHDAQYLPTVRIATDETAETLAITEHSMPLGATFLYDRILCDVPCSGDGTMRKNADVWAKWTPTSGHGMHSTQLQILLRAITLSAPGARIVYSTCSMNPVEDEAVIAAALQAAEHPMRLVDVSAELPLLKRRSGVHSWKCMDNEGNWYDKFEDVPEHLRKRLSATTFPPALEQAKELHLERCMRFLPHDQDTGGFFVAVLERMDAEGEHKEEEKPKRFKKKKSKETPEYQKLDKATAATLLPPLMDFFQLSEHFPISQLIKHHSSINKFYFTTHAAAVLMDNDICRRLRLKAFGTRILEYVSNTQGGPCHYRLSQDGIETMYPFLGPRRVVELKEGQDLSLLLTIPTTESNASDLSVPAPNEAASSSGDQVVPSEESKESESDVKTGEQQESKPKKPKDELPSILFEDFSAPVQQALQAMEIGSVVFSYHIPMGQDLPPHHTLLVGWRGKVSAHLLVARPEAAVVRALLSPSLA